MNVIGEFLDRFPKNRKDFFGLSVSKYKTYIQCKKKYNFQYIQKLPKEERDYLVFGKFLHAVLEEFENKIIAGYNGPDNILMKECYKEIFKEYKKLLTQEQKDEAFSILCEFLNRRASLVKSGSLPKTICTEKPFNINIGNDIILNGFIDVIYKDVDGTILVSDYKTTNKIKYLQKDKLQLRTYSYVMFLENPELELIRCSYILLKHGFSTIDFEFTRSDVMGIEEEYRDKVGEIRSELLYRPTVSPLCKYCDFVEHCDEGRIMAGIINTDFGLGDW